MSNYHIYNNTLLNKISILPVLALLLTGCTGMINDFNNLKVEKVTFPAKLSQTVSCISSAASSHGYSFTKEENSVKGLHQYYLSKPSTTKTISMDMSNYSYGTDIDIVYDRRESELISGLDGVLGYCKRQIG